jgi:hypothetical protein
MVPSSCHPTGVYNLEVSSTFLQSLWDALLLSKILTPHRTKLSANGFIIQNVEVTLTLYPLPIHTESTTVIILFTDPCICRQKHRNSPIHRQTLPYGKDAYES